MVDETNKTILSKVGIFVYKEFLFWFKTFIFISYPVLILACLLLLYAVFIEPTPEERERAQVETMIIGGDIINVLETYHSEHGRYPNTLDDIIPNYVTQIKPPPWGETGWLYKRYKKDFELVVGYEFGYGDDLYPIIIYSSSQASWIVNQ